MPFVFISNDNNVELHRLRDTLSNQLINTAAVDFTLVLSGQSTGVSGQSWPSSMTVVNSDRGQWHGVVVNSVSLISQERYQCLITVTHAGKIGNWKLPVQAIVREE